MGRNGRYCKIQLVFMIGNNTLFSACALPFSAVNKKALSKKRKGFIACRKPVYDTSNCPV